MMTIWQSTVSLAPAMHSPSPWQAPHASQLQDELQARECVPQLPQVETSVLPGAQAP
jgi:hypothetical protein